MSDYAENEAPLSPAQQRLWLLEEVGQHGDAYMIDYALRLRGTLDLPMMRKAIAAVFQRHSILRTRYGLKGSQPYQYVVEEDVDLIELAFEITSESDLTDSLWHQARTIRRPLDGKEPPAFVQLLHIGPEDVIVLISVPHIAADLSSLRILRGDLVSAYVAALQGESPLLAPAPQYLAYASSPARLQRMDDDEQFWVRRLHGLRALDFPRDYVRPPKWEPRGRSVAFKIPALVASTLRSLGARNGATPQSTFLSVALISLARFTGQNDIVVGIPVSLRTDDLMSDIVGCLVETVVVRVLVDMESKFESVLRDASRAVAEGIDHPHLPFTTVIGMEGGRDPSIHPVYQTSVAYERFEQELRPSLPFSIEELSTTTHQAKVDLSFHFAEEHDGSVSVSLNYATSLFKASTVGAFGERVVELARALAFSPQAQLGMLARSQTAPTTACPKREWIKRAVDLLESASGGSAISIRSETRVVRLEDIRERSAEFAEHAARAGSHLAEPTSAEPKLFDRLAEMFGAVRRGQSSEVIEHPSQMADLVDPLIALLEEVEGNVIIVDPDFGALAIASAVAAIISGAPVVLGAPACSEDDSGSVFVCTDEGTSHELLREQMAVGAVVVVHRSATLRRTSAPLRELRPDVLVIALVGDGDHATLVDLVAGHAEPGRSVVRMRGPRELYVVNDDWNVVGQGEIGRLIVAGSSFSDSMPHDIMARQVPGGLFEILANRGRRVPISGVVVDLDEVEAVLEAHPRVHAAIVHGVPVRQGGFSLQGRIVAPASASLPSVDEMRAHMSKSLPLRMRPSLDLPEAESDRESGADELSLAVASIWMHALGLDSVASDTDFFASGGHSLTAVEISTAVRALVPRSNISPIATFEFPLFAEFVEHVRSLSDTRESREEVDSRPEDVELVRVGPLVSADGGPNVPLSFAQARLWFLNQIGDDGTYNIPYVWRLRGKLDVAALQLAIRDLLERHETLRTLFPDIDGDPTALLCPIDNLQSVLKLAPLSVNQDREVAKAAARGYDLASNIPFRAIIFPADGDENLLLLVIHHIAFDGLSIRPLLDDLSDAYAARVRGEDKGLPALRRTYASFSSAQREVYSDSSQSRERRRALIFWRETLAGAPHALQIAGCVGASDRTRPASASFVLPIDSDLTRALEFMARAEHVTPFMVYHTALARALYRHGAGTDIVVGTPVSGRPSDAYADVVGLFVNSVVLRAQVQPEASFLDQLRAIRAVDLLAYEYQQVPFDLLVSELNPPRETDRNPLFQVCLAVDAEASELPRLSLHGLAASPDPLPSFREGLPSNEAKFDISVTAVRRDARLPGKLEVEYRSDLYEFNTVRSLCEGMLLDIAAGVAERASLTTEGEAE